jgi:hypothetical protein
MFHLKALVLTLAWVRVVDMSKSVSSDPPPDAGVMLLTGSVFGDALHATVSERMLKQHPDASDDMVRGLVSGAHLRI